MGAAVTALLSYCQNHTGFRVHTHLKTVLSVTIILHHNSCISNASKIGKMAFKGHPASEPHTPSDGSISIEDWKQNLWHMLFQKHTSIPLEPDCSAPFPAFKFLRK